MNEKNVKTSQPQVMPRNEELMVDFKQLFSLVVSHWRWIVGSMVACVLLAFVYLWFTPTTVTVTGKMEIIDKSKKNSGISAGLAMLNSLPMGLGSSLGGSAGAGSVDSEKEIILSNTLVTDVVKELGLYTEYRLSKWGRKTLLYQDSPVEVSLDEAHVAWLDAELPLYFHQIKLTITKDNEGYTIEPTLVDGKEKTDLPSQTSPQLPVVIKTESGTLTIKANSLPERLAKPYEGSYTLKVVITPPTQVANAFIGRTTFKAPSKNVTNMANVSITDENVMRGIDYVNHLFDAYNKRANDEKNEEALKTDEFVNARLAKIDAELGSSDAAWENSKKNFQITTPEVDAQEALTKKSEYEAKLVAIGTELQLHDFLSDYINDPANIYEIIPSGLAGGSSSSSADSKGGTSAGGGGNVSLIAQHNSLVNQRKDLLKSVSEMSPQVQRLNESIQELQPTLKLAMKRDRQQLVMQRNVVEREYARYNGRIGTAPQMERVLTEIGRQREIKQGVYLVMLQKREETAMELANVTDKGKFVDEPSMVKNSSKPQKKIVLLAAIFLGLLLPIFVLYIRQLLNKKIETPKDLEQCVKAPLIGFVPLAGQGEAIRVMRTNLLQNLKPGQKTVMLISDADGDGKTYLAKQLVESFTSIGKKALYFNADLREAGCKAHPLDVLSGEDFAKQISDVKDSNDYVIIDTPALGRYSDACQISQFADATLFVAKAEHTEKSAVDKLKKKSFPQLMLVLNAIDMSKKKFKYLYKNLAFVLMSLLVLSSCVSTKNITYFQNKDEINAALSKQLYDAKIMPKDILQIQVFSMTPAASDPFNLLKNTTSSTTTTTNTNQNSVYNYLVSNDGTVVMPIIGTIKVGGLSKNEAENLIKSKIQPYLSESENVVVHVRMMNYKYAILGGVKNPGLYTTQNEKVSILEAIAQAGDLTTFAYLDRIYLIRENSEGQKEYHQLNINDANIISSPYYYLQQNDVIYVESRKTEARNAFISSNTSVWFSLISSLMSITTFIIALSK